MRKTSIFLLVLLSFSTALVLGCAKPKQQPMPVGNLKLGVAQFTQPHSSGDMLAGYLVENRPEIDEKVLTTLDALFRETLSTDSKNTFVPANIARQCTTTVMNEGNAPKAALRKWVSVGRCMNVDILVVPQAYEWDAREGGPLGVVKPAGVGMDFFVIDVRGEGLISRSHYEVTQKSLSANLLEAGTFFKRGAHWVRAEELAKEGMQKAIKELGL